MSKLAISIDSWKIVNMCFSKDVEQKFMISIDFEKDPRGKILNISKDVEQKLMISRVDFGNGIRTGCTARRNARS